MDEMPKAAIVHAPINSRMKFLHTFRTATLVIITCLAVATAVSAKDYFVYIGTYTGSKSKGIHVAKFDSATGTLSKPELAAEIQNPTFLAVHPNGKVLYSIGEVNNFGGQAAGAVSAFAI